MSDVGDRGVITSGRPLPATGCVFERVCKGMLGDNLQCVSTAGLLPLSTDCVAKGTVARMAVAPLSPSLFPRLSVFFSLSSHVSSVMLAPC